MGHTQLEMLVTLRNAIQAYGLGKNKERTRKHIIKRARQLRSS